MAVKPTIPYKVTDKDGSIQSEGNLVLDNQSEIMVHRDKGERLWFYYDDDLRSGWVEQGAYSGPGQKECACDGACGACAVPTEAPALTAEQYAERLEAVAASAKEQYADQIARQVIADLTAPVMATGSTGALSAAHQRPDATQYRLPLEPRRSGLSEPSERFAAKGDTQGAPGGTHYSRLHPQPVDLIEAWGLGHHEAEALAHLARWRYKDGKLDLEKAIWWIERLIAFEYGTRSL